MREREHKYPCRRCGLTGLASSRAFARKLGYLCVICLREAQGGGTPACPCCGLDMEPCESEDGSPVQSLSRVASFDPRARM